MCCAQQRRRLVDTYHQEAASTDQPDDVDAPGSQGLVKQRAYIDALLGDSVCDNVEAEFNGVSIYNCTADAYPLQRISKGLTSLHVVIGTCFDRFARQVGQLKSLLNLEAEVWVLMPTVAVVATLLGWSKEQPPTKVILDQHMPNLLQLAMGLQDDVLLAQLDQDGVARFNERTVRCAATAFLQHRLDYVVACPFNVTAHLRNPESLVAQAMFEQELADARFVEGWVAGFRNRKVPGTEQPAAQAMEAMQSAVVGAFANQRLATQGVRLPVVRYVTSFSTISSLITGHPSLGSIQPVQRCAAGAHGGRGPHLRPHHLPPRCAGRRLPVHLQAMPRC